MRAGPRGSDAGWVDLLLGSQEVLGSSERRLAGGGKGEKMRKKGKRKRKRKNEMKEREREEGRRW